LTESLNQKIIAFEVAEFIRQHNFCTDSLHLSSCPKDVRAKVPLEIRVCIEHNAKKKKKKPSKFKLYLLEKVPANDQG
jgi:hypothetical protein